MVAKAKRRSLGKGLDALLSVGNNTEAVSASSLIQTNSEVPGSKEQLKRLPVDLLQRGQYQPRRDMDQDALEELASSIRKQGVIQPIVVRRLNVPTKKGKAAKEDRFEIIAGERRWRASQLAGQETIPAVIRDISDEVALAMALIENIQRENLNPIEEAAALQRLIDEFGLTHQQTAEMVGRSRAAVSNLLRLMALEDSVKTLLERCDLEMGHARALLALNKTAQAKTARLIVAKGLSVRETENLVKKLLEIKSQDPDMLSQKTNSESKDKNIVKLQNDLSETLGAAVAIKHSKKGQGKLIIEYSNLDQLEGILGRIH